MVMVVVLVRALLVLVLVLVVLVVLLVLMAMLLALLLGASGPGAETDVHAMLLMLASGDAMAVMGLVMLVLKTEQMVDFKPSSHQQEWRLCGSGLAFRCRTPPGQLPWISPRNSDGSSNTIG